MPGGLRRMRIERVVQATDHHSVTGDAREHPLGQAVEC